MKKGEHGWILTVGSITSDHRDFYRYIDRLTSHILNPASATPNAVANMVCVIHEDDSCDVYLNDFKVHALIRAKKNVEAAELLNANKIADITRITLPEIEFTETDRVVACLKVGWKFGLYFDLDRGPHLGPGDREPLNVDRMERQLGSLFRTLLFHDVYQAIQSGPHYERLLEDGWFPYIELLPAEFSRLAERYASNFEIQDQIVQLTASFDAERLGVLTEKWWSSPPFASHRPIIEAGISAFADNDSKGDIVAIATLWPQVEGVLRRILYSDTGKGRRVKSSEFIRHLTTAVEQEAGETGTLMFPEEFSSFLRDFGFANFDIETGEIDMSRNTVSHGIADPIDFTRARALQLILMLDQIYFFNGSRQTN